jgi:enoyl-CoA hydratase
MTDDRTLVYETDGRIAHIVLNRPDRGNAITFEMPTELAGAVERACLDPAVHVIALSGRGKGFCGGYDLESFAEQQGATEPRADVPAGSPLDPRVQLANHQPGTAWDPLIDYALMRRNVGAFMSLFFAEKPVICKVHGFCVAGGTDLALCADLLIVEDESRIGYPPARVWGVPTTAMWVHRIGLTRARRLLFTGDSISGREAAAWGLATESAPADLLDGRFEWLLQRVSCLPQNQLAMMKLLINQTVLQQGLQATQVLGTILDGIARHTPEGYAFQRRAAELGFRAAVAERDQPFRDQS